MNNEPEPTPEPEKSSITEEDVLNKYLDSNGNGIPDWMEDDFNWDDMSKWINNPVARLYKEKVVNRR